MGFRYRREKYKGEWNFSPKIPITLNNKDNSIEVAALLDSGSDVMIIPQGIAKILDLKLNKKEKIGSLGGDFETISSKLNIIVKKGRENYSISNAPVYVNLEEEYKDVLIGRRPFFHYFIITFDEKSKRIKLKRIQSRL